MKQRKLFIDVDNTLVSADDTVRPGIREFFEEARKIFDVIVVWSGGGGDYARTKMHRAGVEDFIDLFSSKIDYDKFIVTEEDFFIDDQVSVVEYFRKKKKALGYIVPEYMGATEDMHLKAALEEYKTRHRCEK